MTGVASIVFQVVLAVGAAASFLLALSFTERAIRNRDVEIGALCLFAGAAGVILGIGAWVVG